MKRRADFVAAAKGIRVHRETFTLQARRRAADEKAGEPARVGFTVTKKVGNAVVRNRIRRRLRALAERLRGEFAAATDYVVVAKVDALAAPFDRLGAELSAALATARDRLDRPAPPSRRSGRRSERPAPNDAEKRA